MRRLWLLIGWFFMGLAVVGVALPIMPTVPFLLVAAWAFARSSPKLQQRILNHPSYGHHVRAWQERGAVSRLAKVWAVVAMSSGVVFSLYMGLPGYAVLAQALVCAAVGLFLITRPTT